MTLLNRHLIKFVFLILFPSLIHAQTNRNTVDIAISKIMNGQGVVTQNEYNEFWSTFNLSNKEKQEVINVLRSNFLDMLQFQKYIWKCAEIAWKTKITPSCNNASSLLNKIKDNMGKGGADLTAMVHAEENSRRLLTAAASHSMVISSPNNQSIKLSLDLITQTYASLDGQFNRLNQVLRVKY